MWGCTPKSPKIINNVRHSCIVPPYTGYIQYISCILTRLYMLCLFVFRFCHLVKVNGAMIMNICVTHRHARTHMYIYIYTSIHPSIPSHPIHPYIHTCVYICNMHIYIYIHTIIGIGHQSLFHLKFSHEPQDTSLFSPQLARWYSIL